MKYTFSIHGVPYGSQSWGDIIDSEYLKSFYNSVSASNEPTQMIVDIRYSENKLCTYYHYLVLSNVYDCKSRPGSYFAMTICFEGAYCSDFVELYRLFEACFKRVVLDSVLVKSKDQYRYALEDFDSHNNIAILKKVDSAIRNNISLFEHNLVEFSKSFSPKHRDDGWIEKWSIDDVGNKTFVNILLRDSMVSISPSYPASYKKVEILQGDNRMKDDKIKSLESDKEDLLSKNGDLRNKISNQEKNLESKEATIKSQNGIINGQKEAIASLEAKRSELASILIETQRQVKDLKEELKQALNNRDDETLQQCLEELKTIAQKRAHTDKLIEAINPRLKEAEKNIEQIDNQLNNKKSFRFASIHIQLIALVVVAIIAIVGVLLPVPSGDKSSSYYLSRNDVQTMISKSLDPINKKLNMIDDLSKEFDDLSRNIVDMSGFYGYSGTDSKYEQPYNSTTEDQDGRNTSYIAIGTNKDTHFYRNRSYTVKAKKGESGSRTYLETGGGQFFVKLKNGNEIELVSCDNGKTATLTIGNDWPSPFTIVYRFNGLDVCPRIVPITEN